MSKNLILSFFFFYLVFTTQSLKAENDDIDIPIIDQPMDYARSSGVSSKTWKSLKHHLLPYSHPVRKQLDKIFSVEERVLENSKSLIKAGFTTARKQHRTNIIVTKHQNIPNYIFKLYTDSQPFRHKQPEWKDMVNRIEGADIIRKYIKTNGKQALFKAPHKWLYPVPTKPKPKSDTAMQKYFILVEEDMEILSDDDNFGGWKNSAIITTHILDEVYTLLTAVAFNDGISPDNLPLCKDGRIAFVDTSRVGHLPVRYAGLLQYLPLDRREYWVGKFH